MYRLLDIKAYWPDDGTAIMSPNNLILWVSPRSRMSKISAVLTQPSPLPSSLWHASNESTVSHSQKPSSPAEVKKMVSYVWFVVVVVLFLLLKYRSFLLLLRDTILAILIPKEHKILCPKTLVKKCINFFVCFSMINSFWIIT